MNAENIVAESRCKQCGGPLGMHAESCPVVVAQNERADAIIRMARTVQTARDEVAKHEARLRQAKTRRALYESQLEAMLQGDTRGKP